MATPLPSGFDAALIADDAIASFGASCAGSSVVCVVCACEKLREKEIVASVFEKSGTPAMGGSCKGGPPRS